ncbi:hypothetical protein EW146_g8142 [Bondarzewia mesenterica]|uniref:AB hydrolase-1 domain-containing protein n=1 Tax=Bondarzewia mesenterica TaxID=1095465 RepID=A0A4S4LGZ3_9AGAM|nr:hypothetical protein EW146_g8142 [Bondarzewia mesenterica]
MTAIAHPLPQGVGYGVVLGLGFFFALMMNVITWVQAKYSHFSPNSASEFTAASRSLKTGIVVAGILSSWTWSLTLLQSATESYNIGISGGYWYAVGGTLQIAVFSVIASKVKMNANHATTFPEVAYIRFGTVGHLSFLWCGIVCNAIVSACILLGGGAVVSALTGMNAYAALFLIPVGVAVYVATGGLRATFISDATHTFFLLGILLCFGFITYAKSAVIGSPGKMWDLLTEAAKKAPVEGNYHGSYLTFRSRSGAIFAVQSIITGFGLVTCDQGYWSRAIASNPSTTAKAYFLGGFAWFSIPLACGTVLGLGARALGVLPDFPVLTSEDVGAGLAGVATASYLLGTAGSVLMLLLIFLSVTSALSAEMIATSTLLSYDVYRHYFRPSASSYEVVNASRYFIVFWAIFSGGLASIFKAVGINLGWLFYFLGVATASGVFPIALTFTWKDLSKAGAVAGSLGGMAIALIVWLATAKGIGGAITVQTLSDQWVSFAGNAAAIISGGVLSIGLSLWRPANFDWEKTRNMAAIKEPSTTNDSAEEVKRDEKDDLDAERASYSVELAEKPQEHDGLDFAGLQRTFKIYGFIFASLALIITFIIPVPLGAAPYVFSKRFLAFVVAVMFIWLFIAAFLVVFLPIIESRKALWRIARQLVSVSELLLIPEFLNYSYSDYGYSLISQTNNLPDMAFPALPSPLRETAFGPCYALSTHLVPSAFPRSSADVSQPQVPINETKAERKARLSRLASEMIDRKRKQESGQSLGEGSRAVLWNCLNRYVRRAVPKEKNRKHLTLFFAHANGLHKEVGTLTEVLTCIDEVWTFDAVQHGDSGLINAAQLRGIFDWADNARDILNFFLQYLPDSVSADPLPVHLERVPSSVSEERRVHGFRERSLVSVGHSFGGCSLVLAAHAIPSLFSDLVLIDPVIIPSGYDRSENLRTLVLGAISRRETWSSREEAHRLLSASPFFGRWDPEVLKVYIEHALASDPRGIVRLKTTGIQEATVFLENLVANEAWVLLSQLDKRIALKWIMPGSGPGQDSGFSSNEVTQERIWLRPQNSSNRRIPGGGHLVVQEKPKEVVEKRHSADEIHSFLIEKFGKRPSTPPNARLLSYRVFLAFYASILTSVIAAPAAEVSQRRSVLVRRAGSNSIQVWVPIVVVVLMVVAVILVIWGKRKKWWKKLRGVSLDNLVSPRSTSVTTNANGVRELTAEEIAGPAAAAQAQARPARNRRNNRRTPSQISTRSLPVYMKEPGEHELVIIQGSKDMEDNPMEPTTIIMPSVEETDSESIGHSRNDSHSSSIYATIPTHAHVQTPLLHGDENHDHDNANESSPRTPGDEGNDSSAALLQESDVVDPRGEAPAYFEVIGDLSENDLSRMQSTETAPGLRAPSWKRTSSPHARDNSGPAVSLESDESAGRPSISGARPSTATRPSTHRPSLSGTGSMFSIASSPLRPMSRSRTRSNSNFNQTRVPLTSPSTISISSISAPLSHTLTRTDFVYPKSGPTPEQLKLISSREAVGKFGVPYGADALAYVASTSRLDLHGPPPEFDSHGEELLSIDGLPVAGSSGYRPPSGLSTSQNDLSRESSRDVAVASDAQERPSQTVLSPSSEGHPISTLDPTGEVSVDVSHEAEPTNQISVLHQPEATITSASPAGTPEAPSPTSNSAPFSDSEHLTVTTDTITDPKPSSLTLTMASSSSMPVSTTAVPAPQSSAKSPQLSMAPTAFRLSASAQNMRSESRASSALSFATAEEGDTDTETPTTPNAKVRIPSPEPALGARGRRHDTDDAASPAGSVLT